MEKRCEERRKAKVTGRGGNGSKYVSACTTLSTGVSVPFAPSRFILTTSPGDGKTGRGVIQLAHSLKAQTAEPGCPAHRHGEATEEGTPSTVM